MMFGSWNWSGHFGGKKVFVPAKILSSACSLVTILSVLDQLLSCQMGEGGGTAFGLVLRPHFLIDF
jgi:hypothetical protein